MTTLSVNLLESVPDYTLLLKQDVKQMDIYIVLIALSFFYIRFYDFVVERKHWVTVVLSAVFSLCAMLGVSFAAYDNWNFVVAGGKQGVNTIFTFLGIFVLIVYAMTFIFHGMTLLYEKSATSCDCRILTWIDTHFGIFTLIVFVVCWLPFLIVFYPGSLDWDAYSQIDQFFGIRILRNHHPWPVAFLYGSIVKLASVVGDDNFALFCVATFGFLLCLFSLREVCLKIKKYGGLYWGFGVTLFYCIVPFFYGYAQRVVKDTLYMGLFGLFSIWCLDYYMVLKEAKSKADSSSKKCVCFLTLRLVLLGLLLCLSRHNGIYVVVSMFVALVFLLGKKAIKYALILALATYLCYTGVENFGRNVLEIPDGSIAEVLSIPFQQTARYMLYFPDDVTEEEKAAIDAVLSCDTIGDVYDPNLSDAVKNTFKGNKKALKPYFKAWFTMFLRHPGVYIQATLNNTYKYYCVFQSQLDYACDQVFAISHSSDVDTGVFDFDYVMPEGLRNLFSGYVKEWKYCPVLSLLVTSAFYTWLMLLCAGWLIIQKRKRLLWFLVGAAMTILICIASPVNGSVRYMLPVFASAPVWVFTTFMKEEG